MEENMKFLVKIIGSKDGIKYSGRDGLVGASHPLVQPSKEEERRDRDRDNSKPFYKRRPTQLNNVTLGMAKLIPKE